MRGTWFKGIQRSGRKQPSHGEERKGNGRKKAWHKVQGDQRSGHISVRGTQKTGKERTGKEKGERVRRRGTRFRIFIVPSTKNNKRKEGERRGRKMRRGQETRWERKGISSS